MSPNPTLAGLGRTVTRLRASVGLAVAHARHDRGRTLLAVVGVALAVVAMTMLVGVGMGVLATGEAAFEEADRDLWITGSSVQLAPESVGGINPPLTDAHQLSADVRDHDDVRNAAPMGFQTLYIGTEPEPGEYDRIVGAGIPGDGASISYSDGSGFTQGDTHYADGEYDGPTTDEVVIDQTTADRYGLSVNDTVHLGGTTAGAAQNEYTVVGISDTISGLSGTDTVTIYLSELQTMTGTSGADEAMFVMVTLEEDADVAAVQDDLAAAYPEYDVRTDREQLESILGDQVLVIAGAITLVVLAVVAGIALVVNVLALTVYQQRTQLAALKSIGISSTTIVGMIGTQALFFGLAGGLLGALSSPLIARVIDSIIAEVTGFDGVVQLSPTILALSVPVALLIGLIGATVIAWRLTRVPPLIDLDG